ncbi:hypothetical protein [Microbacterium thalli]|uniref:Uncharacterized protein n=1 Tax=Microbacterium thalli TaxID=3027921 RepID=A0ABT5SE39_9MICO|nr:hypothetical protein [Microbacterium thalli]MDD7928200.1 hypothetical protein [Microbacterium thalli]MDD7960785.1 hypothetical protein [Microbacterium thalli]
MSETIRPTARGAAAPRRAPMSAFISAWAVPILVLGEFALLAAVPVVVLIVATLRDPRMRSMRWWIAALAIAYATPLAVWLLRPGGAESLSKDMSPLAIGVVVAVSIAVIAKLHTRRPR